MSRRCLCTRLFTAVRTDPRLRSLPWPIRAFFLVLGEAMAASENPGVLGFAENARISLLVSVPETDVGSYLETLVAEGLLLRPEGGGLVCPMLAGLPGKASVARENGGKGGRPRKGETAEQARLRRAQPGLMLPLPGAAADTGETKPPKPHDDDDSINSDSSIITRAQGQAGAREVLALAREVATLAGMDPARSDWSARDVQGWLNAGATPALVLEVVADVMTRCRQVPAGLRYFSRAIERAVAENRAAPASVAAAAPSGQVAWGRAFEAHLAKGGRVQDFPAQAAWLAQQQQAA